MSLVLANDECIPSDIRDYKAIWLIPSFQMILYKWRIRSYILIL